MLALNKRIVEDFPLGDLKPHPKNPKLHDDAEMDESLDGTGFSGVIVAQEGTNFILDGHGRVAGLLRKGITHEAVQFLDVDDAMAEKIILSRNRVGSKAGFDDDLLAVLLAEHMESGDLIGTGYDADEVDDLLARFEDDITLDEEEFNGDFIEKAQEQAVRQERKATPKASLGLREVVLVFQEDDFDKFMRAVTVVGQFADTDSTSAAALHGMWQYAEILEQEATE